MTIIVALGVICYANSFLNGFVWDDHVQIEQNRFLRSWAFVPRFFTTDMAEAYGATDNTSPLYRPVWLLSHLVEHQLWGPRPVGYHAVNLALHIASALLLLAIASRLGIRRDCALLAAALFVCHPVNTEGVDYLGGRATLLGALFMLGSLLLYLRSRTGSSQASTTLAGAIGLFALAVFSKESAVPFPFVVLAAGWLIGPRRGCLSTFAAFLAVALGYMGMRWFALSQPAYQTGSTFAERCVLALQSLGAYFGLLVAPVNLHMDRLLPTAGWQATALVFGGVAAAIGLAVLLLWSWKRQPVIAFGICWFAIGHSITSGLVPANITFAERWLYWPISGLLIAGASAAGKLRPRTLAAGWLVVVAFATATIAQNCVWHDDISLYETALQRGSETPRIYINLAWEYMHKGETEKARQLLETARQQNPDNAGVLWAAGAFENLQRNYPEARRLLEQALSIKPNDALSLTWLALTSEKLGDVAKAESLLTRAAPTSLSSRLELAKFYYRQDRLGDAERILREALQTDPYYAAGHSALGAVLFRRQLLDEAEMQFNLALRYDPRLTDAYANLARVASARGNIPQMLRYYDQAIAIDPRNPELFYTLARLLEEHGQLDAARQALRRALEIEPNYAPAEQLLEKLGQPRAD